MKSPASSTALRGGTAYIDDQFVPLSEARIPILDWGFLRSDATYDVAHVWRGSFFRLDDHLDRFLHGMQRLHMSLPYSRDRIREILFDQMQQDTNLLKQMDRSHAFEERS